MQTKIKSQEAYFCTECGYESKKWMGQCPSCKQWNTFTEQPAPVKKDRTGFLKEKTSVPVYLSEIPLEEANRFDTGYPEFSRVLGGGIVPGSVMLVGGDPGIGKSTLLLQTAMQISANGKKVLYISGEESLSQIRLRAGRIGKAGGELRFLSAIDIDRIIELLSGEKPDLCIIDSIQTMYTEDISSSAGSVAQIRECARKLTVCAKSENIAVFIVGHVTKEGTVAGPRVLEHMVDTVLYFESGDQGIYRILRSVKNRFGSTNEIGVFEMVQNGLKEVPNPSEYLLSGRPENASGAAVACLMEGTRPLLIEIQALVTETQYNLARRQALGIDYNRLNLFLAVLEKRAGIRTGNLDAYVNIAGGMRISEPAADLAVISAIISSYKNTVIPGDTVIFGEIGLSGEIRAVPLVSERLKEIRKMGFTHVILPHTCLRQLTEKDLTGLTVTGVRYIHELIDLL